MRGVSPEARRLRAEGLLRLLLLALLVLAPLPFGCVEDWSRWGLITLLGLGFAYFLWAGIPFALRPREKAAVGIACVYLVWLALQIAPLPPSTLAAVSPEADRLYRIGVPGYGGTDPGGYAYPDIARYAVAGGHEPLAWITPAFDLRRTLSLYPFGTFTILCQTAALLAFVVMGRSLFREGRDRRRLALTLVGVAAFEAVYGIFETVTGHQHILAYLKVYYTDANTGTLVNRNHYAGLLNMVLPLAVALALDRARSAAPPLPRGLPLRVRLGHLLTAGGERRPLLLFASVLIGVAVVLSRSRMGIATMLAALLAMSIILAWRNGNEERSSGRRAGSRVPWAAVVPVALLLGIVAYSAGTDFSPTIERFFQLRDDLESATSRPALWAETLPVIRRFLWTGAGAGAYVFALNPNLKALPGRNFWYYDHAHNDYLEALVMLGIVGVVLAAAALLIFCARRPRSLLSLAAVVGLGTLVLHSTVDFLLAIPSNALLACALLCLLAGRLSQSEIVPAPASPVAGAAPRRLRRAAGALVFAAILLGPGRSLAAAVTFRPHWNASPDRAIVAEALRTAASLDPRNDIYPRRLAEAEQQTARQSAPLPLDLGDDLEQQMRKRHVALLGGFVSAHVRLLKGIDLDPLDFEAQADVAESASSIRGLLREVGLLDPDAPISPAAIAAPHLASVALAPTAYGNHASMGWLLWNERAALGEAGTTRALELLRQGLSDPAAPTAWFDAILQAAGDAATLATLDATIHPPSAAYTRLLRQTSLTTGPDFSYCAAAFQAFAAVREASAALQTITSQPGPPDTVARERLARIRNTLTGALRSTKRLSLAQVDAPACSATASPAALTDLGGEIERLLTSAETVLLGTR